MENCLTFLSSAETATESFFNRSKNLYRYFCPSHLSVSVQLSFFCMGVCTMLMVTAQDAGEHKYEVLLLICAVMGLFDGCFVTLIGPIAFDLCGAQGASQAIGSLLGLFSIPMTTGPPVAGIIYDKVPLSSAMQ